VVKRWKGQGIPFFPLRDVRNFYCKPVRLLAELEAFKMREKVKEVVTEMVIQETKSTIVWWSIGKIPAILAALCGLWFVVPDLSKDLYMIPKGNNAGYGEYACMTNKGLITSLNQHYMNKHCPNGIYQFRGYK
jgi:hypothetical protein